MSSTAVMQLEEVVTTVRYKFSTAVQCSHRRWHCIHSGSGEKKAKGESARMLRCSRVSSLFLRSTVATGARSRLAVNDGRAALSRLGATHSNSTSFNQARFLSAARPGSVDEKNDDAQTQGFVKRVMGKESCVVRVSFAICELTGCVQGGVCREKYAQHVFHVDT